MNRRGFFGLFGAAAATAIALPELELLVPKRTIFLPPAGGWASGNQLLSAEMISRECLRILETEMLFMAEINREYAPALVQVSNDGGMTYTDLPRYTVTGGIVTIEGVVPRGTNYRGRA